MASEMLVNVAVGRRQAFTQLSVSSFFPSFDLSQNYSFIRIQANQIKAILYLKSRMKTGTDCHAFESQCLLRAKMVLSEFRMLSHVSGRHLPKDLSSVSITAHLWMNAYCHKC